MGFFLCFCVDFRFLVVVVCALIDVGGVVWFLVGGGFSFECCLGAFWLLV